jgi:hypothetical protein
MAGLLYPQKIRFSLFIVRAISLTGEFTSFSDEREIALILVSSRRQTLLLAVILPA